MRSAGCDADELVAGFDRAVVDHFRSFHRADAKTGDVVFAFGIHVRHSSRFPTDQRRTRTHTTFGDTADDIGREFFNSLTIGDVEGMSAIRLTIALRTNAELAHGCLAIHDDHLVMTDTLMLRDTGLEVIEASIGYLAETADHYERSIFGTDQY